MHTVFNDPEEVEFQKIFFPNVLPKLAEIRDRGGKFVHYSSAEGAMAIVQSQSVWMRNAVTMNDYSEIEHGLECLKRAVHDDSVGGRAKRLIEQVHPGAWNELLSVYDKWLPDMRANTYLTSVSEHLDNEDDNGRLSMWRAYGQRRGVALVLNLAPFAAASDALAANSHPVTYATPEAFTELFSQVVDNLEGIRTKIEHSPRNWIIDCLFTVFRFATLCTKHPGFAEEREWRVIYSPTLQRSPVITESIIAVSGVPQIVQSIPLVDAPEHGLVGADLNNLLYRLIIGPTADKLATWQAFVALLARAGVEHAHTKVHTSGIPLRH